MFGDAADNYASSRYLILNLLWTGFPLFFQSIEKFLKAIIFLETGKPTELKGLDKHNLYALKQELQKTKDYGLDKFDSLLRKLYGHFQQRYYDNKDKSSGMSTAELDDFDKLWMYLFDAIPFSIEVKYRLTFTNMLFDKNTLKYWPNYKLWTVTANKALAPKLEDMEKMHLAIEEHYINSKD